MAANPDVMDVARHLDWVHRRGVAAAGLTVREITEGWVTVDPSSAAEEFASSNRNRVRFIAPDRPVSGERAKAALEAMSGMGAGRMFFWFGPRAWDEDTHEAMERVGAWSVPYVRYPVVVRPAGDPGEDRPTSLMARAVRPDEAAHVLDAGSPWFSLSGAAAARRLIESGVAELCAAFDADRAVGLTLLIMNGTWGHLGFAGTDPAYRGRGAQSALIRLRIRRAAERGARWCTSETVTAVETSLNNLKRAGFTEAFALRVYGWDASRQPV